MLKACLKLHRDYLAEMRAYPEEVLAPYPRLAAHVIPRMIAEDAAVTSAAHRKCLKEGARVVLPR